LRDVEWTPATFDEFFWSLNKIEENCEMMTLPELERVKVFNEFSLKKEGN
jgi:hypothetical protein